MILDQTFFYQSILIAASLQGLEMVSLNKSAFLNSSDCLAKFYDVTISMHQSQLASNMQVAIQRALNLTQEVF